ncbi:MAG TPA: DUF6658 family protein [Allocoleopsis sp.]
MNRVITWVKNIRWDRILTFCLVGLLVVVSTACSGNASATTADKAREEVPSGAVTNRYKGGMNDYSDVDPRRDTSAAKAKAKALIDNAQRNINEKGIDGTEQYVENYRSGAPLGERVKRIGENVGKAAEDLGEQASQGARENAANAREAAQSSAERTKSAAREAAGNTKQAANEAAEGVKSKVSRDVERTQRSVSNAARNAADAID